MSEAPKHFLTGEELSIGAIDGLLTLAISLKKERGKRGSHLTGKHLALIFDKPSLRTRFSFSIAMTELGGDSIESVYNSRKQEDPADVARVLSGYCHGIMIRTAHDSAIEQMAKASHIPVINGLSDFHHPCQILADLMTLEECFGDLQGLKLTYIGDGNNILHSLLLLAPQMGIHLNFACPAGYQPDPTILARARIRVGNGSITAHQTPVKAASQASAVYTDVWTSMGFEAEEAKRAQAFSDYQLNEELMTHATQAAVVLHCLPMNRGKEISQTLPDSSKSVIFQQSENRLHVQKALLIGLLG